MFQWMYYKWLFNNDWLCKNAEEFFFNIQRFLCFFIHFFRALSMLSSFFEISAVIFRHFNVLSQLWLFALYIFNFVCLKRGMLVLNNQRIVCEILYLIKKDLAKRLQTFCVYKKFENFHNFLSINQSIINSFVILF